MSIDLKTLSSNFDNNYTFSVSSFICGSVSKHGILMFNIKDAKEMFIEVEIVGSLCAMKIDGVLGEEFLSADINEKILEAIRACKS